MNYNMAQQPEVSSEMTLAKLKRDTRISSTLVNREPAIWFTDLKRNPRPQLLVPAHVLESAKELYRQQTNPTPPMGQGTNPDLKSTASSQPNRIGHQGTTGAREGKEGSEDDEDEERASEVSWDTSPIRGEQGKSDPGPNHQPSSPLQQATRSQSATRDSGATSSSQHLPVSKKPRLELDRADSPSSSPDDLPIELPGHFRRPNIPAITRASNAALLNLNHTPPSAQFIIPSTDPSNSSGQQPSGEMPPPKTRRRMAKPNMENLKPRALSLMRKASSGPDVPLSSLRPPQPSAVGHESHARNQEIIPSSSVPVIETVEQAVQIDRKKSSSPMVQRATQQRERSASRPSIASEKLPSRRASAQPSQVPKSPYDMYRIAYPDYQGSLDDFARACAYVESLQINTLAPTFLFDDIIRAIHEGYMPYVIASNITNPDHKVMSALKWYNSRTGSLQYSKGIITDENLATILDPHSTELARAGIIRARRSEALSSSAVVKSPIAVSKPTPVKEGDDGFVLIELRDSQLITEEEAVSSSNGDHEDGPFQEREGYIVTSDDDDDHETSYQKGRGAASDEEMEEVPEIKEEDLGQPATAMPDLDDEDQPARSREARDGLELGDMQDEPLAEEMDIEPPVADFEYEPQGVEMEDDVEITDWTKRSPRFKVRAPSSRAASTTKDVEPDAPVLEPMSSATSKPPNGTTGKLHGRMTDVTDLEALAAAHRAKKARTSASAGPSSHATASPILARDTSFVTAVSHRAPTVEPQPRSSPEFARPPLRTQPEPESDFARPLLRTQPEPSPAPSSIIRKRSGAYRETSPTSSVRSKKSKYKNETEQERFLRRMKKYVDRHGPGTSSARSSLGG